MTVASRRPLSRFGLLYAIANVGVFIGFIPLITLILPQRAIDIAPDGAARLLSQTLLIGGIASSIANIGAGWLSDRTVVRQGSRIPLVGVGLILTFASLILLAQVTDAIELIASFILFQCAFNTLFSPFNALATDHIADDVKGRIFGWLSLGLPLSQIVVLALVWQRLDRSGGWLWVIILCVTLLLIPLLTVGRSLAGRRLISDMVPDPLHNQLSTVIVQQLRHDFIYAWLGRFFIQCAAVASGSFMLIHLSALSPQARGGATANELYGIITVISLSAGLSIGPLVGIWSDRCRRRRAFLLLAALFVATGFAVMSWANGVVFLVAGFALFAIGFSGFLTIDGAVIAEIVGHREYRASQLGVINLSNTLPTMVVPGLSLLIDQSGLPIVPILFTGIAIGCLISAWLTTKIVSIQ
jgi:MFS family permease